MTTYSQPSDEVLALLDEVRRTYHARLGNYSPEITIGILIATADTDEDGNPKGDAVKCHGVPAYAVTRAMPLKSRAHGLPDAEIIIDGDKWADMLREEQIALLDHELTHIEPKLDKEGDPKRDSLGRIKLGMRPHDYEFGWFNDVAQRHGYSSVEVKQAQQIVDEAAQFYFDFGGEK